MKRRVSQSGGSTRLRALAMGLLILCLGAGCGALAGCSITGGSSAPVVAGLGAFVGSSAPGALKSLGEYLGVRPQYASDYLADTSWSAMDDGVGGIRTWTGHGYQMIIGVPMLPRSAAVSLKTGATGAYNRYFTTLADQLVSVGMGRAVLRLGWEFNVPANPWYAAGQAASFTEYWRQIATSMAAVPGADFQFEWNPNRGDGGPTDQAMGSYADYYPGNAWVQIIGLDVYDMQAKSYPGAQSEVDHILNQRWGLNWLSGFAAEKGKGLALPEFGLGVGNEVSGGDDPLFVMAMVSWAKEHHAVNFVYWDYGRSSVADNPAAAKALRAAVNPH